MIDEVKFASFFGVHQRGSQDTFFGFGLPAKYCSRLFYRVRDNEIVYSMQIVKGAKEARVALAFFKLLLCEA
jgi:hypothetical protein